MTRPTAGPSSLSPLLLASLSPLLLALALLAPALAPAAAAAQPVPWGELGGRLSTGERGVAEAALRATACYHGCADTVARCLAVKPRAAVAWRLARYIMLLASKGLSASEIRLVVAQRRASAVPAKVYAVPSGSAPRLGDPRAKVVVVEFADFQCSHCAEASPVLEKLVQRSGGRVALVFKVYPLKTQGPRLLAAQAALAAHRQGKFWPMTALLFADPDTHSPAGVEGLARRLGLDLDRFRAALKDVALLKEIEANKILGLRLGIPGTPAIFVNGKALLQRKDELHLRERIEEELEMLPR